MILFIYLLLCLSSLRSNTSLPVLLISVFPSIYSLTSLYSLYLCLPHYLNFCHFQVSFCFRIASILLSFLFCYSIIVFLCLHLFFLSSFAPFSFLFLFVSIFTSFLFSSIIFPSFFSFVCYSP